MPVYNLTVFLAMCSTGEQIFFERMPCNHIDWVIVSFKTIELLIKFSNVVNLNFRVSTASQKPVAVHRIPSYLSDCIVVSRNCVHSSASCPWIPHFYIRIFAASHHKALEWMPVTWFDIRSMVAKRKLFFTSGKIPNFTHVVIGTWYKFKWRIRKG